MVASHPQISPFYLLAFLIPSFYLMACSDEVEETAPDTDNENGFELREECLAFGDPTCFDGSRPSNDPVAGEFAEIQILTNQLTMPHPVCVDADGLGRDHLSQCDSESQEVNLHSHCIDAEDAPEGSEPCIWWGLGRPDEEYCSLDIVCAPEAMLTELGWPDGQGFNFHLNCGFDLCDSSTWRHQVGQRHPRHSP